MADTAYSLELTFSQQQFDTFARLSGDDNPIHVDPDFAATTLFGATVAHGMMLFGFLHAASLRWLAEPLVIHTQELMFPAPTLARRPYQMQLEMLEAGADRRRIGQRLVAEDGTETARGEVVLTPPLVYTTPRSAPESVPSEAPTYKGLELGMKATQVRSFTRSEVAELHTMVGETPLVDDSNIVVPPALLGGMVSCLLGVELPGPGTNWLKQRYEFLAPAFVGQDVTATVRTERFRPDKDLVNLSCTIRSDEGLVATGYSLVHTQDVAPR